MDTHVEAITQIAEALRPKLVGLRRDFYRHPELSGDEVQTARAVARHLRDLGLAVKEGVGGHGVVALAQGARPGPVLAYRADMDALPVQDALDTPYRSMVLGVKHACGHDVHMAVALGVAEVLTALRESWGGTVKFIFQPAEESLDGARAMLADEVLDAPRPRAIVALHVLPIPVGRVGVPTGLCLAGMREFRVRLYSPGGNLEVLKARVATALRALSTGKPPAGPATFDALVREMQMRDTHHDTLLVSCWPRAGGPSAAHHLLGLASVPQPSLWENVDAQIRQTLDHVTRAAGATYDVTYTFANPPLINDAALVRAARPAIARAIGEENVMRFASPYPFAHEDFSLYTARVPGALFWLGITNAEKGIQSLLHAPDFDVDEDALVVGVRAMASLLLHTLIAPAM